MFDYISRFNKNTFKLLKPLVSVVLSVQNAHESRCAINVNKSSNIKKLEQYFPEEDKSFYTEIFNWPSVNIIVAEEDSD